MQNAKYQLLWNDEMQNAKIFMGVFSSMENGYLFAKNFAWCLVPFCKIMGQNLFFLGEMGN
jgi:hypothetical protein